MKRKIVGYHIDAIVTGSPNLSADMGNTSAMILPGGNGPGSDPKRGVPASWARN
jgi:hypothetical protein